MVYSDFVLVYNTGMRRVIYYLNPVLNEDGVRHLIAWNVLDPIIYDRDCYQCVRRLHRMVQDEEVWLVFISFLVYEHSKIAIQVMNKYSNALQVILLSEQVSVEDVGCVLRMEKTIGVQVFYNNKDSHVHWICCQAFVSRLAIEKIRIISLSYGPEFLKWIPKKDWYARYTMVTAFLWNGYVLHSSPAQENALVFLINACPDSLGIVNIVEGSNLRHRTINAFSCVVCQCNDPCVSRHVMIARMVMQYATINDMRRIHNGKRDYNTGKRSADKTLLAMAVERGNRFVAQMIVEIFDAQLTRAELVLLRTLE